LPHRGFNNYRHRTEMAVLNVGDLGSIDANVNEVNAKVLAASGLIRGGEAAVKILGDGEVTRAFKVTAAKFTTSAKAKIEKAGGQAIVA
jgi:large subunit ribosomal protein L15